MNSGNIVALTFTDYFNDANISHNQGNKVPKILVDQKQINAG